MKPNHKDKESNPIIKTIETALEIWIKSRCNHLEYIDLDIKSSPEDLLNGNLSTVKLKANNINFKNIFLTEALIESNQIKLCFGFLNPIPKIDKCFKIKGSISFNSNDLERTILSKEWKWVGDLICMDLLGINNIKKIKLRDSFIRLEAEEKGIMRSGLFSIFLEEGKITINNKNLSLKSYIPMDKNIIIRKASLSDGIIQIFANSLVQTN